MRTPAAYNNNLKNHIITMQMLVDCLYNVTGNGKRECGASLKLNSRKIETIKNK